MSSVQTILRASWNANDDPTDPLVREFYETLGAYEQLLTEKNGSTTIASRTAMTGEIMTLCILLEKSSAADL